MANDFDDEETPVELQQRPKRSKAEQEQTRHEANYLLALEALRSARGRVAQLELEMHDKDSEISRLRVENERLRRNAKKK